MGTSLGSGSSRNTPPGRKTDAEAGPRRLRVWRAAGITTVNLGAVFLLVELVLRVFPSLIPPGLLQYFNPQIRTTIAAERGLLNRLDVIPLPRDDGGVPHRLWHFRPGSEHHGNIMDEQGFCNSSSKAPPRVTGQEVLFLGDSFTYCWFVPPESTWVSLVARAWGVPYYNLGVPDMGPYEYVQFLKQYGLQLAPTTVVMAVYEGNDLRDAVRHETYRATITTQGRKDPQPRATNELSTARRLFFFLQEGPVGRHSYAANLLLTAGGVAYKAGVEDRATSRWDFRYELVFGSRTVAMNSANVDSDELDYGSQLRRGDIRLDVFTGALKEFVRLSRDHDFVPLVVFLPSAHSVYALQARFEDTTVTALMPWVHDQFVAYFSQQAGALGFSFVDLTGPLRAAALSGGPDDLLYRPNDLHFTPIGHAAAAAALARLGPRGVPGSP